MMNRFRNEIGLWLVALMAFLSVGSLKAEENAEPVDVQEIVFSHIQDAYTWHVTEIGETEISVPLPVIVWDKECGLDVFLSSRLHGGNVYNGYKIAEDGEFAGKIVRENSEGEYVRPVDLSMTKNVCAMLLGCALLLAAVLGTASWYKKHPNQAPGGFVGMMEAVIMYMQEEVIIKSVGKEYKMFSSYLLTVFFFILFNNLLGIIPIFPGGANVTGNIAVTMVLSVFTFLAINLFATKGYWKDIFWPKVPIFLKLPLPIMPFVEFFGVFTKPFALMIRLFANIMAGHTIILALTCLIFITASMGAVINSGMTVVSVFFSVFMNCMELFVACLQAYIFTLLSANYIGSSKVEDED